MFCNNVICCLELHAVFFIMLHISCGCNFTLFVTLCYLCSFKTKDVPSSGPYVVEAMKVPNGKDTFWETVLYNDTTKYVIPIGRLNTQQIEC